MTAPPTSNLQPLVIAMLLRVEVLVCVMDSLVVSLVFYCCNNVAGYLLLRG